MPFSEEDNILYYKAVYVRCLYCNVELNKQNIVAIVANLGPDADLGADLST